jgi:4-hydroxy-2-oxoheptanedioate aldolase
MPLRPNRFKEKLIAGKPQIGLFTTLASTLLAEIFAGAGFDWVLIDTEHSPNELPNVIAQLQALAGFDAAPIVRPAWSDEVLVKRVLDAGAQTLLFPYIQNAEEAAYAVRSTRYPPHGRRGVSGSSRAADFGLTENYLKNAADQLCVLVQIETVAGLDNLEAIAAVEGVDGVFIGPADLAASLGHLGNTKHPDVQAAIDDAFRRIKAAGKPSGYLTMDPVEAERRLESGVGFVGVATDTFIVTRGARELVNRFAPFTR